MNFSESRDSTRADLTPEMMLVINRHCDRREAQWQVVVKSHQTSGDFDSAIAEPETLAVFLTSVPESEQVATVPELILIDLSYRGDLKLPITAQIFSDAIPWLDRVWLEKKISELQQKDLPVAAPRAAGEVLEIQELGDYTITGTLGRGGMGHVYRAVHKIMGRMVAIKTMHEASARDLPARRRFEREVKVLAKLSHPNIVTAFDAREHDHVLYLVTELVEGEDLSQLVARNGPLKPRDAMYYVWQAAKGLAYAHEQGIIHRDVKPSNLILEKSKSIKVLDLGLARLRNVDNSGQADCSLTDSGHVLGTARFMAPEQARSAVSADERADIYSLGCTLYFLLTGQPPFRGESAIDTILAHSQQPIPDLPPEIVGRTIAPELRDLVASMMAKAPANRPQAMSVVVQKLENLVRQTQSSSRNAVRSTEDAAQSRLSLVPPVAKANRRSHGFARQSWGWRASLLGFGFVIAFAGWWFWPRLKPTNIVNRNEGETSAVATSPNGLRFDGRDDYLQVTNFQQPTRTPFVIQVLASPAQQNGPANLVSWTGEDWAALFITAEGQWGLGWLHEGRSQLIVAREPVQLGEQYLVAGRCDENELQLFVDGQLVVTDPLEFELEPTELGLYIGGMPLEVLPPNHGSRFFHGVIHAVRIDQGAPIAVIAQNETELLSSSQAALVCFLFGEGNGDSVGDESLNQYIGQIFGAEWVNE